MKRRACLAYLMLSPLAACSGGPGSLVKSDTDRLADMIRREVDAGLLRLADKLYRRNPHEWRKNHFGGREEALRSLADGPPRHEWRAAELVSNSLRQTYAHDRVAAFIGGLLQMVNDAFGGRREFFLLDELDPQKLYNAARNMEIAAWKLGAAKRSEAEGDLPAGSLLLLSNAMEPVRNLSFEREFGRLIAFLDILASVVASKTERSIAKVVQNLASSIFLPI